MSGDTFIAKCLRGEEIADGIDAFIARWHSGADTRPLHIALGMTRAEYARWVADPGTLSEILASRALRAPARRVATGRIAVPA